MFTSLIFIGTACIVNMTITINGPKPATGTREGWHILFPAFRHHVSYLFFRPLICSFELSLFIEYLLRRSNSLAKTKFILIVNICFGSSEIYEGNGKIFFHVVFQRKKESPLIWYFQGEFHKVYFWQAFSEDRRLQKQGVIRVKLRENVGFPAWTRLVKHRLCLQHCACMLLTVCSLEHTSKCLTKVEGCRIVKGNSGRWNL